MKTAEQLQIKGLMYDQPSPPSSTSKVASATVVSDKYDDQDRQIIPVTTGLGHEQSAQSKPTKNGGREGRKGYQPKKLRMSGDSDSARSGTSTASPIYPISPEQMDTSGAGYVF